MEQPPRNQLIVASRIFLSCVRWPEPRTSKFSSVMPFSKSNSGASAILVDEFDAGCFKCSPNDFESGATRLAQAGLQLVHSDYPYSCLAREVLLTPSK